MITRSSPKRVDSQTLPGVSLKAGLYVVPTPIGNLGDITLRALSTLHGVDLIACEDTRVTAKLLRHYDIKTPTDAYHEHNAMRKRPELLARIAGGERIALVSDAGTPLISDPGYKLLREAVEQGLHVEALPGASSVMVALCVSALPTDRFLFAGFLPAKSGAARETLTELTQVRSTLVFFESAKRLKDTLPLMAEILGNREAVVARELTKLYEETRRGTLQELAAAYAETEPKGELVIVIGPLAPEQVDAGTLDMRLRALLAVHSLRDAVAVACEELRLPHNQVYKRALAIKHE